MTEWFYTKMGIQQGPVPEDELRQKIRRGEIGESNLIWREGMADWLPFAQIPELQSGAGGISPAEAEPIQASHAEPLVDVPPPKAQAQEKPPEFPPPASQGMMQMEQPPAYHGDYVPPNIPTYLWQSIVALGISCFMILLVCLPLGVPFAIVALVYASKVDGLKAQQNFVAATSASRSAKTWMIISFVLTGLMVLGFLGLMAFALMAPAV